MNYIYNCGNYDCGLWNQTQNEPGACADCGKPLRLAEGEYNLLVAAVRHAEAAERQASALEELTKHMKHFVNVNT